MREQLEKNTGITLVILVITVVVMLILLGVSLSNLDDNKEIKQQLGLQENIIDEFYNTANVMQGSIQNELKEDYNKIISNPQVEPDTEISDIITTDDWTGFVNAPRLLDEMTAIYFDTNGAEVELTSDSSEEEWDKWYNYSNKEWANAKTSDGSYWVWIPRFAYKITEEINEGASSNISVIFVDKKNMNSGNTYSVNYPEIVDGKMSDYVVHPAFATNIENGGTNSNISGFWIAKYEMSREDSGDRRSKLELC